MPRNSSGVMVLPAGNPVVPGTLIESGWANPTMADIANELTGSLPRNGSAPMTGPLVLSRDAVLPKEATTLDQLNGAISGSNNYLPAGAIQYFAMVAIPSGWLEANGAEVSRTTYANLFATIGTVFGSGNGTTTFNLPDLRGTFIRGFDNGRSLDPGRVFGSLQSASNANHTHAVTDPGHSHSASQPAHTHAVTDPGHSHSIPSSTGIGGGTNLPQATYYSQDNTVGTSPAATGIGLQSSQPGVSVTSSPSSISLASSGGEARPVNITLVACIKAFGAVQTDGLGTMAFQNKDSVDITGGFGTFESLKCSKVPVDPDDVARKSDVGTIDAVLSSDTQVLVVDDTDPRSPVLRPQSNVPYGLVKLNAAGEIPPDLIPLSDVNYQGPWDASDGMTPSQRYPLSVFSDGDSYQISVAGTLTVFGADGSSHAVLCSVGGTIIYVTMSPTFPTEGWYYNPPAAFQGTSADISFYQSGAGSVLRTSQDKMRESFSVKDKGAIGSGEDSTSSFSAAAKEAASSVPVTNSTVTISASCQVNVPAGSYALSSAIDSGGRSVDWVLDEGATLTGTDNLGGRISRGNGSRVARPMHYGCFDTACSQSITANYSPDEPPAISGISSDAAISTYASRDSVDLYLANTAPAALYELSSANYTANSITCSPPVDPKKLRVGMIIDTGHSPKYSGFITSWADDGSSITVSAWYQFGGSAGTPPSGISAAINPITKIWAQNSGVTLNPVSYGDSACGYEMDLYNNRSASDDYSPSSANQMWGFDSYATGPYPASAGYVARGLMRRSYVSDLSFSGSVGFSCRGTESVGFSYDGGNGTGNEIAFRGVTNGLVSYSVSASGSLTNIGRTDAAVQVVKHYHTSGASGNAYDVRTVASGGMAGTPGKGSYTLDADTFIINAGMSSVADAAVNSCQMNKTGYTSGNSYFNAFLLNGVVVGSIYGNGSTTSYATSSDYRLKYDAKPMENALEKNDLLNPVTYKWLLDGAEGQGFIAHELQKIFPDAVCGEKDAVKIEQYEVRPEQRIPCVRQRQKMSASKKEVARTAIELVDGVYVEKKAVETIEVMEPAYTSHLVWNSDGTPALETIKTTAGIFTAQKTVNIPVMEDYEDYEVIPAVMGEREVPDYQGIDTSFLVGHLVACVQELTARIKVLEARL